MLTFRLSVMMFLELFIWGAYFVSMGIYLPAEAARLNRDAGVEATASAAADVDSDQSTTWTEERVNSLVANAYSAIPLGALVAPLFLGLLADRLLPAQVVLGGLHLIGAVLLWMLPEVDLSLFVPTLIAYAVVYMPTLGLSNTVAFHAISESSGDSQKQFPVVRVFGTIGWIVAGLLVSAVLKGDDNAIQFRIAAIGSLLLGVYSFTLPSTPPAMKGKPISVGSLLGFDALSLLKNRSFATFIIASTLLCIPLAFYYQSAAAYLNNMAPRVAEYLPSDHAAAGLPEGGFADEVAERTIFGRPTAVTTIGQMSEIGFMLLIPFFFRRLGTKWMLLVGMFAWVVRYLLFAFAFDDAVAWMLLLGVVLHGICYDFFFVTGQIYVDKASPAEIRGQAQGLLVLLTQGLGMIVGAQLNGLLATRYELRTDTPDWPAFWIVPAIFAAAVAAAFWALFKERRPGETIDAGPTDEVDTDSVADDGVAPTEPSL